MTGRDQGFGHGHSRSRRCWSRSRSRAWPWPLCQSLAADRQYSARSLQSHAVDLFFFFRTRGDGGEGSSMDKSYHAHDQSRTLHRVEEEKKTIERNGCLLSRYGRSIERKGGDASFSGFSLSSISVTGQSSVGRPPFDVVESLDTFELAAVASVAGTRARCLGVQIFSFEDSCLTFLSRILDRFSVVWWKVSIAHLSLSSRPRPFHRPWQPRSRVTKSVHDSIQMYTFNKRNVSDFISPYYMVPYYDRISPCRIRRYTSRLRSQTISVICCLGS